MKCPTCNKREAQLDPLLGYIECEPCQDAQHRLNPNVEMTTGEIKEQRSSYLADILQPRRDGVLSKEYLETFGSLGIQATPEEIKNAKYVWQDLPNINSLNKTQKVKRKRDVGAGVKKKK